MKRFLPFIVAAFATLPGCGYFTNIPAQVVVAEVKPASLVYGEGTTGNTIKIDSPEVTLRTEAGSIGATYSKINIAYYDITSHKVPDSSLPPVELGMTIRVEGSQFPSNPLDPAKGITQANQGQEIWVGRTTVPVPVVTRHVEQYGASAGNNYAAIYALVTLKGVDDANFDSTVTFFVPIIFSGLPSKT